MFPPDYSAARQRFRDAASRLGWTLEAYPVPSHGPHREELTIDVAASQVGGPAGRDRVLVVSSGMHGVEGPFGSAVQVGLLERWARESRLPESVGAVFVHALNPYGFAWGRRTDEANIDPNRNFILEGGAYAGSPPGYAKFDRLLNPRRPPSRLDPFYLRAVLTAARYGIPALKQSLVVGQYDYPGGLFFGGHAPSSTRLVVQEHLRRWIAGASLVVHLDLHTGLGQWGRYKLLVDYSLTEAARDRLVRWFGREAIEEGDSEGAAGYRARGSFGPWCVARAFAPEYLFAFVEFGTYNNLRVLAGLRAENQAHHWSALDAAQAKRAKARLRELFCPADPEWRSRAVASALRVVAQAIEGLAEG